MENRIIIVGNSSIVLQNKLGANIDQFKYIVRFNNFNTEGYEEYVGKNNFYWGCSLSPAIKKRDTNIFEKSIIPISSINTVKNKEKRFNRLFNHCDIGKIIFLSKEWCDAKNILYGNTQNKWLSTGILVILYFIEMGFDVYIHGFSSFSENSKYVSHYFENNTSEKVLHNRIIEKNIIETLIKYKKIRNLNE
jgi:hypothetical protein